MHEFIIIKWQNTGYVDGMHYKHNVMLGLHTITGHRHELSRCMDYWIIVIIKLLCQLTRCLTLSDNREELKS